jgi:proteasome lid subunit RPN8/RPN11
MSPDERAALIAHINAAKVPTTQWDPTAAWDPSLDVTAANAFKGVPQGRAEQAGVFYGNADNQYSYSLPVTTKSHDEFALRSQIPKGQHLAGIYHVHPGLDDFGQYFSPHDIDVANQLKVPSYIMFLKDGAIRKYTPGETATHLIAFPGTHQQLKVAQGDALTLPNLDGVSKGQQLANALKESQ